MQEAFGLQIVGPASWGAQRIEDMLYHAEMRTVFSAGNGEVEIYEVIVPAVWQDRRLDELVVETGCVPAAVTRAGRAMLPAVDMLLEEYDVLHVSATADGIESLRSRLTQVQEE
jgi:trk system potassium uptake protein TrkA